MNIISHLVFLFLFLKFSLNFHEINQVVFLNPQTNSALIKCPLDFTHSLDIQWYDVINQTYDLNRGRYYRIHGLQAFQRELICSSISTNDTYKIKIQTYDRPLPIQYVTILNITNTSLTLLWIDDNNNRNANITFYELILKYNNIIQSRILVNNTISIYTFSSLNPNTIYSIDISVIDIWKRYSKSLRITGQTYPLISNKKLLFNQIIDYNLLDQSISCYDITNEYLLIEFNNSKFQILNHIYNLTIYDNYDHIILTNNLYSSVIYNLKEKNFKYKINLIVSTIQSEYLGKISKNCEDFYPIYSPLICSIKLINQNKYHLIINMQLYNYYKYIKTFKPNYIFYKINQNYFIKKNIDDIHQYFTDVIMNVGENYSVIMENYFLNEKLNISISCSINRTGLKNLHYRISNGIIICLGLLLIILITLISNCCYRLFYPRLCKDSMDDNFDSASISIDQFSFYVSNMHKDNNFGFIRLFKNISKSSKTSKCLSKIEYINANYIDGYEKTNAYIATQGSMRNTINNFWRMIWEKDVNVIVMITNVEEYENIKYDVYWPEDTEVYENMEVTLVSTTSFAYYIKRIFEIRCKTNQKFIDNERLVHQFHYTDWPDHGVPVFPLSILSFIRRSSAYNFEINGPIVVHCSGGVDRTGTYIIIDTMLKRLNDQQSLNIPSFLKHIRQQRTNLVQTEEEFIFIYDVILEAIQVYKNFELNKQNFDSIIQLLNGYDKDSNLTRIEKQFQQINNYQLFNSSHGLLKQTNEEYIHGYYRTDEFIITEHPMMNTTIHFWQMIWDNRTNVIVSLYADEKSIDYWPLLNQIIDCGDFNVYLIDEHFQYEYIDRDCLLRSTKENYELRVKIISSSYWPDTCSPIRTSFNLINIIRNLNSNKPIVVHDQFGGHRAATFCALYTMKEQIENEGILNVYELAKFYSIKRPGIWRHSDDLLFLYHCAAILFRE